MKSDGVYDNTRTSQLRACVEEFHLLRVGKIHAVTKEALRMISCTYNLQSACWLITHVL